MKDDFEIENGVLIKYRGKGSSAGIPEKLISISLPEGVTEPVAAGSEGVTCYVVLAGDNPVIGNPSTYTDTIAIIPINPEEA